MKLLPLSKLNSRGIAHFIVPMLLVVVVGVAGVYTLVSSHAATKEYRGKVTVKVYKQRDSFKTQYLAYSGGSPVLVNGGALNKISCSANLTQVYALADEDPNLTKEGNKSRQKKVRTILKDWKRDCRLARADVDLYVKYESGATGDIGKCKAGRVDTTIDSHQSVNVGKARSVSCTAGRYTFFSQAQKDISTLSNPRNIRAYKDFTVTIAPSSKQTISLGSLEN